MCRHSRRSLGLWQLCQRLQAELLQGMIEAAKQDGADGNWEVHPCGFVQSG
jgi:hypothetical protein